MRTPEEVALVRRLAEAGWSIGEIAREVKISRRTVSHWVAGNVPEFERRRTYGTGGTGYTCPVCSNQLEVLPREHYVYLLGLYLGDIARHPRDVYRLRIFCCDAYPQLMDWCEESMAAVLPAKIGRVQKEGCTEVASYSKHWPCLVPQHGPGRKHERKIELAHWQQEMVDADPRPLLRGLIHSDGCRVLNRAVGTKYPPYPRYHFANASADIREIFTAACDAIGVEWRYNNPGENISVARRASVAILDEFIGPKT